MAEDTIINRATDQEQEDCKTIFRECRSFLQDLKLLTQEAQAVGIKLQDELSRISEEMNELIQLFQGTHRETESGKPSGLAFEQPVSDLHYRLEDLRYRYDEYQSAYRMEKAKFDRTYAPLLPVMRVLEDTLSAEPSEGEKGKEPLLEIRRLLKFIVDSLKVDKEKYKEFMTSVAGDLMEKIRLYRSATTEA